MLGAERLLADRQRPLEERPRAARSPWPEVAPARSLRLVAVSGCSEPSAFARIASARSLSGRAPASRPRPVADPPLRCAPADAAGSSPSSPTDHAHRRSFRGRRGRRRAAPRPPRPARRPRAETPAARRTFRAPRRTKITGSARARAARHRRSAARRRDAAWRLRRWRGRTTSRPSGRHDIRLAHIWPRRAAARARPRTACDTRKARRRGARNRPPPAHARASGRPAPPRAPRPPPAPCRVPCGR